MMDPPEPLTLRIFITEKEVICNLWQHEEYPVVNSIIFFMQEILGRY